MPTPSSLNTEESPSCFQSTAEVTPARMAQRSDTAECRQQSTFIMTAAAMPALIIETDDNARLKTEPWTTNENSMVIAPITTVTADRGTRYCLCESNFGKRS